MKCAFGFRQVPDAVSELFDFWLPRFKQEQKLIVVDVPSVLWTIWKCRDSACLENKTGESRDANPGSKAIQANSK